MAPLLSVENISKSFHTPDRTVSALDGVAFGVNEGEFVTIIGPSGSGKSTLLNLLAGLLEPDSGSVHIGREAGVSYMPQKDLLLPWRRVIDNATLPLEATGMKRAAAREIVAEHMEEFGLSGFEQSYPAELSGGMRQRAALLRTISAGSGILLLDEPFGALDALTRRQMQDWLLDIHRNLHRTVIFITHDVDEAVYLGDRVIVLSERPGRVIRELQINLARPRHQRMIALPEFGNAVAELLGDLGIGVPGDGR